MAQRKKYQGNITSQAKQIIDSPKGGTYVGSDIQPDHVTSRNGRFRRGRQTVEISLILIVLVVMVLAFLIGRIDLEMIFLLIVFGLSAVAALDQWLSNRK